jgi:DNA polymerase III subunit epsilon
MLYAIVDIETTGSYAKGASITEIAIIITDGEKLLDRYESLINPESEIPYFITKLTGINQSMVASAPTFEEVGEQIYNLLHDKVFVAHNVNFDYSFVHHQLKKMGLELQCKKLCTVRYGKKVIKGLQSYSLGNFCRALEIPIENRHRAGGDCYATFLLLKKIFEEDTHNELQHYVKVKKIVTNLPLQLNKDDFNNLPTGIGVYYFLDAKDKIIYIGKAKNIKKRVASHFAGNKPSKQRQEFIRHIKSIQYKLVSTELMALILESSEIKKYWPKYNVSQKYQEQQYGIYVYENQNGTLQLGVDKRKKQLPHVLPIANKVAGLIQLRKMVESHQLCPLLCSVPYMVEAARNCLCDLCTQTISTKIYNKRVTTMIEHLQYNQTSFVIIDKGLTENEKSIIAFYKGNFVGMGYAPLQHNIKKYNDLSQYIEPYKENNYINYIITQQALEKPELVITF